MKAIYSTFRNMNDFIDHILSGGYDDIIYNHIYDSAHLFLSENSDEKNFDPVKMFDFTINFTDIDEYLYIIPSDIRSCYAKNRWELNQKEKKIALLLGAIIRDCYEQMPDTIKSIYERRKSHE